MLNLVGRLHTGKDLGPGQSWPADHIFCPVSTVNPLPQPFKTVPLTPDADFMTFNVTGPLCSSHYMTRSFVISGFLPKLNKWVETGSDTTLSFTRNLVLSLHEHVKRHRKQWLYSNWTHWHVQLDIHHWQELFFDWIISCWNYGVTHTILVHAEFLFQVSVSDIVGFDHLYPSVWLAVDCFLGSMSAGLVVSW